jgi:hypothetical protein
METGRKELVYRALLQLNVFSLPIFNSGKVFVVKSV